MIGLVATLAKEDVIPIVRANVHKVAAEQHVQANASVHAILCVPTVATDQADNLQHLSQNAQNGFHTVVQSRHTMAAL